MGVLLQTKQRFQQLLQTTNQELHPAFKVDFALLIGPAGCGKSHLIKENVALTKKSIKCTAPTGKAAIDIDGVTIYSLLGVKNNKELIQSNLQLKLAPLTFTYTHLLIDEAFMLPHPVVDKLYQACKDAGLKLVLVGDPFQISNDKQPLYKGECFDKAELFFLDKVYRQKDPLWIDVLLNLRKGEWQPFYEWLCLDNAHQHLIKAGHTPDSITLAPTNRKVKQYNRWLLATHDFQNANNNSPNNPIYSYSGIKGELLLTKGSRVFIKSKQGSSSTQDLVNGDTGTVIKLEEDSIKIQIDRTQEVAIYEGNEPDLPLLEGHAGTVHVAQGRSIPGKVQTFLDSSFNLFPGALYVALSRATKAENNHIVINKNELGDTEQEHINFFKKVCSFDKEAVSIFR